MDSSSSKRKKSKKKSDSKSSQSLKPHHHTVHHHQKQHNIIHLTQEQQHKLTEQSEKTSSEVMLLEALSENQLLMKDSESNKKTKKKKSKKESNRSAESSFLDTEVSQDDSWKANLMELGQHMLSPVADTKIAPSHPSPQPTAFESFPIKPEFTIWDDEPFSNFGSHDKAIHKRKSSTMTDLFNSYLDSDSMSALTYGDMTPRPSHTSSGKDLDNSEVSHQLLMSYLLSMGTDRTTAEQLALTFLEEQKQIASQVGTMNKPIAVTAGSKMNNSTSMAHQKATEAMLQPKKSTNNRSNNNNNNNPHLQQRPNSSSQEIHQDEEQDLIEKDDDYINLSNRSPTSFTPVRKDSLISALVAEVVPATESEAYNRTPVVYAETVKLGVKDLFHERPVRRFACILGCLLVIGMIVLSLFLTVFKKHGSNSDASSMSPSAAPTFINQEILDAAYKISGEEVFYVEESPQRKAVAWMSSVDLIDTVGFGDAFVQRYSLIVFYYSLNGEQWTSQERWLNPTMHECTWSELVKCDYDASEFQVLISMDIPRNNLQGTIPPEIGQFVSMESLSLPKNKISGVLPSSLGKLTSLNEINLSDNLLNGEIPSAISALSNLFSLDLSINGFDSTIPTSVFSLTSLRTLTLSSNKFSGTLNKQVNNLQSLKSIDIRGNALTGTFPIDFDSLPELDIVYLDNNKFSGELPLITNSIIKKEVLSLSHNSFVGNAQLAPDFNVSALVDRNSIKVRYIDISYNKLTGPISATFMVLPGLRYFDLSGNTFTGTFPSYVQWDTIEFLAAGSNALSGTLPVGWPTLTHLDMSDNNFQNGIPTAICDYPNILFLFLSSNPISSTIPSCLGSLSKLRGLGLSSNILSGTIPSSFLTLTALELLDLSDNSLSGSFPKNIGSLTVLKGLNLGQNRLSGTLPSTLGALTDLTDLQLSENIMTGTIPSELAKLYDLGRLHLIGNEFTGEVPKGLCSLSSLSLSTSDLGPIVSCSCCQ